MSATHTSSSGEPAEDGWISEVLRFWFDEVGESRWFAKSGELDARIRERFLALHERIVTRGGVEDPTPRALLAAIIVLDQFSRNLFRGTARAYAADPIARRLARSAIDRGVDAAMSSPERQFLYLPFQHSESREDQAFSIALFARLGNEDWMHYAIAHKAIVDRFGRFPHRNEALGRESSADEIALLEDPHGSF